MSDPGIAGEGLPDRVVVRLLGLQRYWVGQEPDYGEKLSSGEPTATSSRLRVGLDAGVEMSTSDPFLHHYAGRLGASIAPAPWVELGVAGIVPATVILAPGSDLSPLGRHCRWRLLGREARALGRPGPKQRHVGRGGAAVVLMLLLTRLALAAPVLHASGSIGWQCLPAFRPQLSNTLGTPFARAELGAGVEKLQVYGVAHLATTPSASGRRPAPTWGLRSCPTGWTSSSPRMPAWCSGRR